MARPAETRRVCCYFCRHRFEVGAQAMSLPCPKCHRALRLDDVIVRNAQGLTRVQTCGRIVVERRGRLMARQVEAHGGVSVQGVLEANVVSEGAVEIGSRAEWKGDCRAPVIVVEAGARIAGGYFSVRGNGAG